MYHLFTTVTDIDECDPELESHTCNGNATCENTEGSYLCTCNVGFVGNGVTCTPFGKSTFHMVARDKLGDKSK